MPRLDYNHSGSQWLSGSKQFLRKLVELSLETVTSDMGNQSVGPLLAILAFLFSNGQFGVWAPSPALQEPPWQESWDVSLKGSSDREFGAFHHSCIKSKIELDVAVWTPVIWSNVWGTRHRMWGKTADWHILSSRISTAVGDGQIPSIHWILRTNIGSYSDTHCKKEYLCPWRKV